MWSEERNSREAQPVFLSLRTIDRGGLLRGRFTGITIYGRQPGEDALVCSSGIALFHDP